MQLEGKYAFAQGQLRIVVREIQHQDIVQVVLNVRSLGDDHDLVPVVELEQFLEPFGIDQRVGDRFLAVFAPSGLLADQADAAPLAALVVDESGDAGQLNFVADLVLVAADDPLVSSLPSVMCFDRYWMPELLVALQRNDRRSSKSFVTPSFQIRNVLPLAGFSGVVSP